jgi:trehalose-phosphatase
VSRATAGRLLLLLTDFDGTLAEIVPHPDQAAIVPSVRESVERFVQLPDVLFGVVSGRRLRVARGLIGTPVAFAAGLHGLEMEGPRGPHRHPALASAPAAIADVFARAKIELAWCAGLYLENKTYSLTCHVRGVPQPFADRALEQFALIAQTYVTRGLLALLSASAALELLPASDWHKGKAVEWMRAEAAREKAADPAVIFLGDDRTDEDAFAALRDGDVAIGVGARPRERLIDWRLTGPESVGRFLDGLRRLRQA